MKDNTRKCRKCEIIKPITEFKQIRRNNKTYISFICRICFQKNKQNKRKERYHSDHIFRQKINDENHQRRRILYKENEDFRKEILAYNNARKISQLKNTPSWADLDIIKDFYKQTPEGLTVDHIHPLNGKNVCGLHVEYNLQYLTRSENSIKNNKFPESGIKYYFYGYNPFEDWKKE